MLEHNELRSSLELLTAYYTYVSHQNKTVKCARKLVHPTKQSSWTEENFVVKQMTYPLLSTSPFRWICKLTESSLSLDSQVLNFKNSWNNVTYFVCKSIKIWRLIKNGASRTVKIHQKDAFTDISYMWFSVRKISA